MGWGRERPTFPDEPDPLSIVCPRCEDELTLTIRRGDTFPFREHQLDLVRLWTAFHHEMCGATELVSATVGDDTDDAQAEPAADVSTTQDDLSALTEDGRVQSSDRILRKGAALLMDIDPLTSARLYQTLGEELPDRLERTLVAMRAAEQGPGRD